MIDTCNEKEIEQSIGMYVKKIVSINNIIYALCRN